MFKAFAPFILFLIFKEQLLEYVDGGRELHEGGMVLRERRHGPVQRRDGRDEVLLVLVELGEVLLAHCVRLPESGVVLRDLGDLYAENGQTLQGSFSAGWLVLGCIEAKFCK